MLIFLWVASILVVFGYPAAALRRFFGINVRASALAIDTVAILFVVAIGSTLLVELVQVRRSRKTMTRRQSAEFLVHQRSVDEDRLARLAVGLGIVFGALWILLWITGFFFTDYSIKPVLETFGSAASK